MCSLCIILCFLGLFCFGEHFPLCEGSKTVCVILDPSSYSCDNCSLVANVITDALSLVGGDGNYTIFLIGSKNPSFQHDESVTIGSSISSPNYDIPNSIRVYPGHQVTWRPQNINSAFIIQISGSSWWSISGGDGTLILLNYIESGSSFRFVDADTVGGFFGPNVIISNKATVVLEVLFCFRCSSVDENVFVFDGVTLSGRPVTTSLFISGCDFGGSASAWGDVYGHEKRIWIKNSRFFTRSLSLTIYYSISSLLTLESNQFNITVSDQGKGFIKSINTDRWDGFTIVNNIFEIHCLYECKWYNLFSVTSDNEGDLPGISTKFKFLNNMIVVLPYGNWGYFRNILGFGQNNVGSFFLSLEFFNNVIIQGDDCPNIVGRDFGWDNTPKLNLLHGNNYVNVAGCTHLDWEDGLSSFAVHEGVYYGGSVSGGFDERILELECSYENEKYIMYDVDNFTTCRYELKRDLPVYQTVGLESLLPFPGVDIYQRQRGVNGSIISAGALEYQCDTTLCPPSLRFDCQDEKCSCYDDFFGSSCQFVVDESMCPVNGEYGVCSGHGTCVASNEYWYTTTNNLTDQFMCRCDAAFNGTTCDFFIFNRTKCPAYDPSLDHVCNNHGTCTRNSFDTELHYCDCLPPGDYFGDECQYFFNRSFCPRNDSFGPGNRTCSGHGTCFMDYTTSPPNMSYLCVCQPGFYGEGCNFIDPYPRCDRRNKFLCVKIDPSVFCPNCVGSIDDAYPLIGNDGGYTVYLVGDSSHDVWDGQFYLSSSEYSAPNFTVMNSLEPYPGQSLEWVGYSYKFRINEASWWRIHSGEGSMTIRTWEFKKEYVGRVTDVHGVAVGPLKVINENRWERETYDYLDVSCIPHIMFEVICSSLVYPEGSYVFDGIVVENSPYKPVSVSFKSIGYEGLIDIEKTCRFNTSRSNAVGRLWDETYGNNKRVWVKNCEFPWTPFSGVRAVSPITIENNFFEIFRYHVNVLSRNLEYDSGHGIIIRNNIFKYGLYTKYRRFIELEFSGRGNGTFEISNNLFIAYDGNPYNSYGNSIVSHYGGSELYSKIHIHDNLIYSPEFCLSLYQRFIRVYGSSYNTLISCNITYGFNRQIKEGCDFFADLDSSHCIGGERGIIDVGDNVVMPLNELVDLSTFELKQDIVRGFGVPVPSYYHSPMVDQLGRNRMGKFSPSIGPREFDCPSSCIRPWRTDCQNEHHCSCLLTETVGYFGNMCEIRMNFSNCPVNNETGKICSAQGMCLVNDSKYYFSAGGEIEYLCDGWGEFNASQCPQFEYYPHENACSGHGTCGRNETNGEYYCACENGFSGEKCQRVHFEECDKPGVYCLESDPIRYPCSNCHSPSFSTILNDYISQNCYVLNRTCIFYFVGAWSETNNSAPRVIATHIVSKVVDVDSTMIRGINYTHPHEMSAYPNHSIRVVVLYKISLTDFSFWKIFHGESPSSHLKFVRMASFAVHPSTVSYNHLFEFVDCKGLVLGPLDIQNERELSNTYMIGIWADTTEWGPIIIDRLNYKDVNMYPRHPPLDSIQSVIHIKASDAEKPWPSPLESSQDFIDSYGESRRLWIKDSVFDCRKNDVGTIVVEKGAGAERGLITIERCSFFVDPEQTAPIFRTDSLSHIFNNKILLGGSQADGDDNSVSAPYIIEVFGDMPYSENENSFFVYNLVVERSLYPLDTDPTLRNTNPIALVRIKKSLRGKWVIQNNLIACSSCVALFSGNVGDLPICDFTYSGNRHLGGTGPNVLGCNETTSPWTIFEGECSMAYLEDQGQNAVGEIMFSSTDTFELFEDVPGTKISSDLVSILPKDEDMLGRTRGKGDSFPSSGPLEFQCPSRCLVNGRLDCQTDYCGCLNETYFGENCQYFIDCPKNVIGQIDLGACSELAPPSFRFHGYCFPNDSSGVSSCICTERFNGSYCGDVKYDVSYCPVNKDDFSHLLVTYDGVCSGHGECVADWTSGEYSCVCDESSGYTGSTCENWNCGNKHHAASLSCGGMGKCLQKDSCHCDDGYFTGKVEGQFCDIWYCHSIINTDEENVCGGETRGTCEDIDTCNCKGLYYGKRCQMSGGAVLGSLLGIFGSFSAVFILIIIGCVVLCLLVLFVCFLVCVFSVCVTLFLYMRNLRGKVKLGGLDFIELIDPTVAQIKMNKSLFEVKFDEIKVEKILGEGGSRAQ